MHTAVFCVTLMVIFFLYVKVKSLSFLNMASDTFKCTSQLENEYLDIRSHHRVSIGSMVRILGCGPRSWKWSLVSPCAVGEPHGQGKALCCSDPPVLDFLEWTQSLFFFFPNPSVVLPFPFLISQIKLTTHLTHQQIWLLQLTNYQKTCQGCATGIERHNTGVLSVHRSH